MLLSFLGFVGSIREDVVARGRTIRELFVAVFNHIKHFNFVIFKAELGILQEDLSCDHIILGESARLI